MPLQVDDRPVGGFPNPDSLPLSSSKKGVITIIAPSNLPRDALQEADNLFLYENGQVGNRPGVDWFGTEISDTVRTDPVVTTNLVANPSVELNSTGWSGAGGVGVSVARVTTDFYVGAASLEWITGSGNGHAEYAMTGLTIGQYYAIQARVKTANVADQITLFANFASGLTFTTIVGTGGTTWDLITVVVLATATSGAVIISNQTGDKTHHIDALMVENAAQVSDYFDGSYTDTDAIDYAWTGSANASTSTRTTYTLVAAAIDGFDYFDLDGVIHLVASVGGTVYRSLDDGTTWDVCSGGTLTGGYTVNMNQNGSFLYLTNSIDAILRYNGTTTLQAYTPLTALVAPTVGKTGLAATTYTYWYKTSQVNQVGFTEASPATSITVSQTRDGWDTTANFVTVSGTASTSASRVDVYLSEDNINFYYLGSSVVNSGTGAYSFKDDGTGVVVPSTLAPSGNTTEGPKVAELVNVGIRQFGVRDPENPYRIWFTGAGVYSGAFSSAYDGGYLDWQPGGKYKPVHVEDYRDGKGTPIATIWCDSADGQGCILQMSLDTLTIGTISITVPSAYKLPGSRGTSAPGSVVNVLNDYMFENSQAFYNLGSRAQLLNILSTDESSANIRPTVKQISGVGESNIASVYSDGRVLFSVPFGTTYNNTTIVFDTERKAWLPTAFTIGFSKFLRYTDINGARRLLALRPGDNRLSEISENIRGDYGVAFSTSLLTGEYPVSKNRFDFQFVEEAELELAGVSGQINIELLGYERANGYSVVKSKSYDFSSTLTDVGWDTFGWDIKPWDNTADTPSVSSANSEKKYFNVQKEMNTVQWRITTSTLSARYIMRTLQTWGTPTQGQKPTSWRIP